MRPLRRIFSISAVDLQTIAIASSASQCRCDHGAWLSISWKICSVTWSTGRSPFTETSRPLRS